MYFFESAIVYIVGEGIIEDENAMQCPSFERLIDHIDNRLSEADAAGVATHLSTSCAACAEIRDWYQQVSSIAASDDSLAPPPWVLQRASRIFETQRGRPGLVASLGETIASLIFDSHAQPAVASARSAQPGNRQLLYRAGDYSIDLQLASSQHMRADLTGQVLKDGDAKFESVSNLKLDFVRDGKTIVSIFTNEMGAFKVPGMEQGAYDLRVWLSEASIAISDLKVIAY